MIEEKLLTFKELQNLIPIGRTKIYDLIKKKELPKPLKLGKRSLWRYSEIQKFISNLD